MIFDLNDYGFTGLLDTSKITSLMFSTNDLKKFPEDNWGYKVRVGCGGVDIPLFFAGDQEQKAQSLYEVLKSELMRNE